LRLCGSSWRSLRLVFFLVFAKNFHRKVREEFREDREGQPRGRVFSLDLTPQVIGAAI
jgi:hypothetical protein